MIWKDVIQSVKNGGYKYMNLWRSGRGVKHYVHRLVAMAFLDNPNNYPQVNHIDGNRGNNNLSNLEWCTCQHNNLEAFRCGYRVSKKGQYVSCATLTDAQVIEMRALSKSGWTTRQLSDHFKYDMSAVRKAIKKITWSHI